MVKSFLFYTLIIIVLLTACSKQEISETAKNSTHINFDEPEATVHDVAGDQLSDREITQLKNLMIPMEMETPEINYKDMGQELLSSYTEPIKEDYKFLGRFSDEGYAYILGLSKSKEPVLRDLGSRLEDSIGYIQLGHWIGEDDFFIKVYDLPNVRSFFKSKDGELIYLGIKQYSDLDYIKYSNLGEVFDEIVNDDRLEYINQLHENNLRAIIPFGTAYIAMFKWKHGEKFYAYKPISFDELHTITGDNTEVSPKTIDGLFVRLYNDVGEALPIIKPMNQSLYKMVEDYYEVRSLDEIEDITSIKLIRKQPEGQQSKIVNIEDADTVDEITKVLKNSEISYISRVSYEDLLILTKEDGSEIELQISPYSLEWGMAGDGFILGESVCYSPGEKKWIEFMDKYFNR